jgi:hypothetical protein
VVRAAENWADISGVVDEVGPDPARPGWMLASVALQAADPVEGYPNMLAPSVGSTIRLAVRPDEPAAPALAPGMAISARARLAAPRLALVAPDTLTATDPATG